MFRNESLNSFEVKIVARKCMAIEYCNFYLDVNKLSISTSITMHLI